MSADLLWAPPSMRQIFAEAEIGQRCLRKCSPWLVIEDARGLAWIAACGFRGPYKCGAPSVLYRLGARGDLSKSALALPRRTIGLHLRDAIGRAVPLTGDPIDYTSGRDVKAAEYLGVESWGVTYVGTAPAAVGFNGDGCAIAFVAFNEPGKALYEGGSLS